MPYCSPCDRYFPTAYALQQHLDNSSMHAYTYECETCDRTFTSQHACDQHMDHFGHWAPTYECETCTASFTTQYDCDRHMDRLRHRLHWCYDCKRGFQNDNNLRMHLNSRTHQGTSVDCPFCKRSFTAASGASHHLETGSCPSARGLNRDTIHQGIRSRDPHGVITMKQLEWNTEIIATSQSWNGRNYECYICHREFSSLPGLNQHLKSPIHQQKIYHCPNRRGCAKEFKSLAALFNHLESESCEFIRFGQVNDRVSGILTGRQRLIGF